MEKVIPIYPKSIHRMDVIKQITADLRKEGHEIPKEIEDTIQGIYNQNCEGYSKFEEKPPGTEPVFKSKNKGGGYWSVHPDHEPVVPFDLDDF